MHRVRWFPSGREVKWEWFPSHGLMMMMMVMMMMMMMLGADTPYSHILQRAMTSMLRVQCFF